MGKRHPPGPTHLLSPIPRGSKITPSKEPHHFLCLTSFVACGCNSWPHMKFHLNQTSTAKRGDLPPSPPLRSGWDRPKHPRHPCPRRRTDGGAGPLGSCRTDGEFHGSEPSTWRPWIDGFMRFMLFDPKEEKRHSCLWSWGCNIGQFNRPPDPQETFQVSTSVITPKSNS